MGNSTSLRTRARATALAILIAAGAASLTGCTALQADEAATSAEVGDGTQNTTPAPTETVAAPDGGTTDEIVPDAEQGATTEVSIDESAELSDGTVITIAGVQKLDVEANTPGEVAGPAVAVTLDVKNDSDEPIELATAMVSLTSDGGVLGQPTTSDPAAPLAGSLAPGDSTTGVYVFLLPADDREGLAVTVEYVAGAPIALFSGDTSKVEG